MSIHKKPIPLDVKSNALARIAKKTCHPLSETSLIATFREMRTSSGKGAGIDGIKFDSLSDREWEAALGLVSKKLFRGTFEPSATKQVRIRKGDGVSHRKLSINTIIDRVVSKACLNQLVKCHDADFYEWSYGSRPGRSRDGAFNELRKLYSEGLTYYHKLDVKDAFDKISLHRLHRLVADLNVDIYIKNSVHKLINGINAPNRDYGIGQGNPLGGFLFNLFMHHHFDSKLNSLIGSGRKLLRYVDDILIVGSSLELVNELKNECYQRLRQMRLAWGKEFSCDIKKDKISYLGLTLHTIDNNLIISLPDDFSYQLDCLIDSCLNHFSPRAQILSSIRGWMNSINMVSITQDERALINQAIKVYGLELNNQMILVHKAE